MIGYYTSIDDMPIFNWYKIHESADLSYVCVKRKKLNDKQIKIASECWTELYNDYISRFGFSESFLEVIEKQQEIALLMIQRAETGDESIETLIDIRTLELNKKQGDSPKIDFMEMKSSLEKSLGFRINIKDCSVNEFYSYLKTLEKK